MNNKQPQHDTLMEAVSKLPQEITPSRDLWPNIAGQLACNDKSPEGMTRVQDLFKWFNWRLAASLTGAAFGVLLAVFLIHSHSERGENASNVAARLPGNYLPVTLNTDYRAARGPLVKTFTASLEMLSPTERAKVEQGLGDIQSALRVLNEAARQHPENMTLQHLILNTYQRELEYMQSITTLTKHLPEDITL